MNSRLRNIRTIFNNWKRGIVFLEWKSEELRVKERIAVRHLKCRILQQWRVLAAEGRAEVENRAADAVRGCILRYPFRLWRLLLQASVLRKTMLTSRGITNFRVSQNDIIHLNSECLFTTTTYLLSREMPEEGDLTNTVSAQCVRRRQICVFEVVSSVGNVEFWNASILNIEFP